MTAVRPVAVLCVFAGVLLVCPALSADDVLAPLRWNSRVLLVFSPHADDPRARETDRRLAQRACDVADRDLAVVRVPHGSEARLEDEPLGPAATARLRERFRVAPGDYTVLLVGKDGGEKLRSQVVPEMDDLFGVIDGMPMRRQEMRDRGRACTG